MKNLKRGITAVSILLMIISQAVAQTEKNRKRTGWPAGQRSAQPARNQIPAELVGTWSVATTGLSESSYAFHADGSYESSASMGSLTLRANGTLSVEGNVLVVKRKSGVIARNGTEQQLGAETTTYRWQVIMDPVIRDQPVLWLTHPNGDRSQFYGARIPPKKPSLPLKVEVTPWKHFKHPTHGHEIFLDMNRFSIDDPNEGILYVDVSNLPNGRWVILQNTKGEDMPIRVFRDGYVSQGLSPIGKLLVEWLP